MMKGLLAVNDEYKAIRGQGSISVNNSSGLSSAEQFVAACLQIGTCEDIMLAAISSSSGSELNRIYKDGNTSKSLFDRWGTELEYRWSNNQTGSGPVTGVDNAILPLSRDPFFASAGPDGEWDTDDDINTTQ